MKRLYTGSPAIYDAVLVAAVLCAAISAVTAAEDEGTFESDHKYCKNTKNVL